MAEKTLSTVTLKCVNHRHLLWNEICKFLDDGQWVDVDVKCEGFVTKAHRLVLAVFCPTLRERLTGYPATVKLETDSGPLPTLDLDSAKDGLRAKDARYLMEFVYRGQVTVPERDLDGLLGLARNLRVASLIDAIGEWTGEADDGFGGERKRATRTATRRRPVRHRACKNSAAAPIDRDGDRPSTPPTPKDLDPAPKSERPVREKEEVGEGERSESWATVDGTPAEDGRRRGNASKLEYRKLWRQKRPLLKCAYCAYETRDKGSFKSHVAKHDPLAERFVCDVCSKTFRSKRGFRCHQRGHSDPERLHRCPHCDFHTPQKWSWLQHLAVIHRVDPRGNPLADSIRCADCDFACVAEHQLKAHQIRKHTADKPFKCAECDYSAVVRYELDKHVGIKHRNERPYMCETCGFRSQTQSGFERHKRSHTGVKPFRCDLCGQAYADNRKLKSHLLRHASDEKPFVCHLCGHACRRRDNLQMHLKRIHKTAAVDGLRATDPTPAPDSTLYALSGPPVDEPPSLSRAIYETTCVPSSTLEASLR